MNISGLQANTYSASITVTATGASNTPRVIPVTLTVSAPAATMSVSPTAFTFTATQGAANPASQTLSLRNTGGGTLTWSVGDNQNWLTVGTPSGTTTTETDSITISVSTLNLQANTYNASITVTATGASNTPQIIPVTLTVNLPATSAATLSWDANTELNLAFYRVYMSTNQGVYGGAVATVPAENVTHQVKNLPASNTYWFTVTAVDTEGNESAYSNEVSKSIP